MAFNLTRMTVYALISSLEEDVRSLIKLYINSESQIDSTIIEKSKIRIEKDIGDIFDDIFVSDIIDYCDLGDTYQIINRSKNIFPQHISNVIKSLTREFEKIVPIRNRVMHIRPLNFDDLRLVKEFCEKLIEFDRSVKWIRVENTLKNINENPSFVLSMDVKRVSDVDSLRHNLPMPDFDETGLIGRDGEVEQVLQLCLSGFPVISIVGEGGVGKSALALKVAYELVDKTDSFDAVVWVTSKTTQITLTEIKEIKGAIDTSFGIIQEIGKNIPQVSSQAELTDIVKYMSEFRIALFIDNLETILDDSIRNFVSLIPSGSKIIITSRIGLGAYEYPLKLQGIEEGYASQLLRSVAKIRGVESLYKLPEPILRSYVQRMHRNPSYIKWFVSSVQTGLSPEVVLQNSDIFLDFCMSNVYEYLSSDSQKLTGSMLCAPGPRDIPELAYLNDFDAIRVQRAIQQLMSTNMLSQTSVSKGSSVKTRYELSELARAYLSKHHKPSQVFQKLIREKRNKINSMYEEQINRVKNNKYSIRSINCRDKSDRVVARKLYDVQAHMEASQHDMALEILKELQMLAPDYFEVARHMAQFHQKSGNYSDAREQYELAITLSPRTSQLHYWFGKFLLQDEENVEEALEQFLIASTLDSNSVEISLSVARCYLFLHRFDESQKILDSISYNASKIEYSSLKIYHDTEIQISYRRADDYCSISDFENSILNMEEMRFRFERIESRFKDRYMRKKLEKCVYVINRLMKCDIPEVRSRAMDLNRWLEEESVF